MLIIEGLSALYIIVKSCESGIRQMASSRSSLVSQNPKPGVDSQRLGLALKEGQRNPSQGRIPTYVTYSSS